MLFFSDPALRLPEMLLFETNENGGLRKEAAA